MAKRNPKLTWPRWHVQFNAEAPTIGSGWRAVHVKEGNKWVHVYDPYSGHTVKFKKAEWGQITTNAKPLPPMKRRRAYA